MDGRPLADSLFAAPDAAATRDGVACLERGPVVEVVLDRPHVLNALNLAMWRRLAALFRELAEREDLRVVVVRGVNGRAFSAGADIAEFMDLRVGREGADGYNASIADALLAIRELPVPTVAMISGPAVGGGCELAAACDLRIASSTARFGIPIGRLGVTLGAVEAASLVSLVGPSQTKRMILTGELLGADEALRIGLVDRVVAEERLEQTTRDAVQAIVDAAPIAVRANKLLVNGLAYGRGSDHASRLDELTTAVYDGDDLREGIRAFLEKRAPRFGPGRDGG